MRRVETYVGQQVYEWLFSAQAQNNMTAMAKVCAAIFGTGGTVNGLACGPTSPATMTVQIGAGEIYQMENLEATACGTLPADTTHTILKQGIQLGTYTTATFAAPTTSGQSINYLIEAQYQDSDISLDPTSGSSPVVLQYYNATNPSQPWSGPNNSGSTSNTFRDGIVAYQIKAGVAATTGSQVTPSPDTGWIGLWVVTVPYGATSLTSSNISQYTGSPILPTSLLQSLLTSNLKYGVDSGTVGVVQAKFPIPVTTLVDGMDVWVKIAAANLTTATFTPNPGVISAAPVVGAAHAALQGGELVVGGRANFVWRADITSWVLVECTGAAIQVAPATASQHAPQMAQVAGFGGFLNLTSNAATGATTATWTADEMPVATALGGVRYLIPSFSGTLNLAATGIGGMDTGTATASSFIAVYAAYNPSTGASGVFAQVVGASAAPLVYGGANRPSGYTATRLISIVPTNTTVGQFSAFAQTDRAIMVNSATILSGTTSSASSSFAAVTLTSIPYSARAVRITGGQTNSAASNSHLYIAQNSSGVGGLDFGLNTAAGGGVTQPNSTIPVNTPRTLYWQAFTSSSSNTLSYSAITIGYEI
ncbi:hypothetical protein [Paraburkholderia sp. Ac-20347]|uniref:hypothetical protein n=1 Tax=Paraburkholderia sp. Ac-20347 TaxID=2703892 RepID=UPI001981DF4D|nr:hypothetical protein [Paraburkholderia sp. Ac-20347]MBN3811708.1 hypothetical protein [Paraburkholderia sp. Ac-20347]